LRRAIRAAALLCGALAGCGATPPPRAEPAAVDAAPPAPTSATAPSAPPPDTPVASPPRGEAPARPRVKLLELSMPDGDVPREVVERIVRSKREEIRACYARALARTAALAGRIRTSFVIERDGTVSHVADAGSDVADAEFVACVHATYADLAFPQPERGAFAVVIALEISPPLPRSD